MRLIAIVRLSTSDNVVRVCHELADAGLPGVEVTLNTPGALEAISALGGRVGAGSVRSADQARRAQEAGAAFLVTPTLRADVLAVATVPVVCGAFTPTEIELAQQSGAACVKVFPASVLGPRFVKEVLAPMPELRLVPTGGVTLENLAGYAAAGAVGVGVGSSLVTTDLPELRRRAKLFLAEAESAWS